MYGLVTISKRKAIKTRKMTKNMWLRQEQVIQNGKEQEDRKRKMEENRRKEIKYVYFTREYQTNIHPADTQRERNDFGIL